MTTYWEIKTAVFNLMDANSDSGTYLPLVWSKINDVGDMICKWVVTSILDEKIYTAGDLWFLYDEIFYDIVKPQPLTEQLNIGDTVAKFTTTDYNDEWYVYINGDKIPYTSKISTEIQGLTVVKTSHLVGSMVEQLYTLPSNISQPFTVFLHTQNTIREIPAIDERFIQDAWTWYSIVNASWVSMLRIIWATQGKILVKYYKEWVELVDDDDVCILPDRYPMSVLAMLVAGELLYQTEEVDNGATKLKMWYNNLNNMYKYFANRVKKSKQTVKPQSYNYQSILWWSRVYGKRRNFTTN